MSHSIRHWSALPIAVLLFACQAPVLNHDHASLQQDSKDARQLVSFPDEMRIHTLSNMRDHLQALQDIQGALGREQYDRASTIAEERLGLTSLKLHGAHDVAKFMPVAMQAIGSAMHRDASRFAVAARDAGATGDVKPALAALSAVTAHCVACHAGFRIQ